MSDPSSSPPSSTNSAAAHALKLDDLGLKLQTTLPSAIVRRSGDYGTSRSVGSTLRGPINKMSRAVVDEEPLPEGWTRLAHPDSGVYYVNQDKGFATSADMLDPRTRSLITEGADALRRSLVKQEVQAVHKEEQKVYLVLDVQQPGNSNGPPRTACYYCVSHAERRVFWLKDVGHGEVEVPCTSSKCPKDSRLHCIEAQYWKHCELFPISLAVTKDIIGELKGVLLQASADRLLVKFSTSPYDKDHLAYMLNLVKDIEADIGEGSGHSAWIIARFMALYTDGVFRSSFGQSDDFFDIDSSGPSLGSYQRHPLLTILAVPFLRTPDVFAFELHSFHENFTLTRWSDFVRKVDQSIRDSNLLATVLLSTNVGFLAWCDGSNVTKVNKPSAAQIVSYISIICSVGSIIIGLAIFKQYRATGADTPLRAVVVLRQILKEPLGLERLAIICSLPYVLLMWSLIAFLASFAIVFYQDTGIDVRIPVSLALFFVVFSLFFCMYTAARHYKEDPKPTKTPLESKLVSDDSEKV